MPIRPENRGRYPKNWPEIRARILERADNRCEFCGAENYKPHPVTGSKVVLTIAHLDHTPEHSYDSNLRALCQKCHNSYDAPMRRRGIKERKEKGMAKKSTSKKLKNYIAIILDRSGSMGSMRKEAVDAFNQQVKAIREGSKDMETKVSLVTFSTIADVPKIWNQAVGKLKTLQESSYKPDGMTAMYDAVGETITKLKAVPDADDPNVSFLVVVISDGVENNSKRFNSAQVAELVKSLQDTNRWTFTYLGANQDLSKVSQSLNIPMGNTMSFAATPSGLKNAASVNAVGTNSYLTSRMRGQTCSVDFYNQDKTEE